MRAALDCIVNSVNIETQLRRINKNALKELLDAEDQISFVFPAIKKNGTTVLVLKDLKTESSVRTTFIRPNFTRILK